MQSKPFMPTPTAAPELSALIATRSGAVARSISHLLSDAGFSTHCANSYRAVVNHLSKSRPYLVISDDRLGDGTWEDIMSHVAEMLPSPRLIVLSDAVDASLCAKAINLGAYDVLVRPPRVSEIQRVAHNAAAAARDRVKAAAPRYG